MTRIERLKIQLNRIKGALQDLEETGNHRERAARIFEIKGYLSLFSDDLERIENEEFRRDPAKGAKRAIIRENNIRDISENEV